MTTDEKAGQGDVSGTPKQEGPTPWKSYTAALTVIGVGEGMAPLTGKTGFGAIFITAIILGAIAIVILGCLAGYSYVKKNTTVKNRQVHFTIPLAVGISLLFLAAGTGVAYAEAQGKHQAPTPTQSVTAAPPSTAPPSTAPPSTAPPSTGQPQQQMPSLTLTNPDSIDVVSVAFSPDGKTVAAADVNGGAFLYSAATGDYRSALYSPNRQSLWAVAFSHDGTMLAIGTGRNHHWDDGSFYLWKLGATPKLIATGKDPEGGLDAPVVFSPNDQILAWSDNKGAVYLYNIATGTNRTLQAVPESSGDEINGLAFSPDGRLLAAAASNGGTHVWTVATGKPFGSTLFGPNNESANGVAFSPGGTTLAVADTTGTVDLWSLASGTPIKTFRAPSGAAMQDVVFTPDGRAIIATASSSDNPHGSTICAWNVATTDLIGKPLRDPATDGMGPLAISPDGKTLAVGDGNAHAYLWNLNWLG